MLGVLLLREDTDLLANAVCAFAKTALSPFSSQTGLTTFAQLLPSWCLPNLMTIEVT